MTAYSLFFCTLATSLSLLYSIISDLISPFAFFFLDAPFWKSSSSVSFCFFSFLSSWRLACFLKLFNDVCKALLDSSATPRPMPRTRVADYLVGSSTAREVPFVSMARRSLSLAGILGSYFISAIFIVPGALGLSSFSAVRKLSKN